MTTQEKIKVLIVDDHEMVRYGIRILLEAFESFEVVGDTGDGRLALTLCSTHHPDVVLMDLLMPGMDGVTMARLIHKQFPGIQIVALTSSCDEILLKDALNAGINSYIIKTGSIDEVVDAIKAAYCGQAALSPEIVEILLAKMHGQIKINHGLTNQEIKVLGLLTKGLSNFEIAENLVITLSTAKAHVSHILTKLEVSSRMGAIALAKQRQILKDEQP